MKLQVITCFMRIGREHWEQVQRPASFYEEGLVALRKVCEKYGHELTVFGNTEESDIRVEYTDMIRFVGEERFNTLEKLRCLHRAEAFTARATTWYSIVQHLKYALLLHWIKTRPGAADFMWIDAGAASHSWVDHEGLLEAYSNPVGSVAAFRATWRTTWEGCNLHKSGILHPGFAPAGTVVAGSRAPLRDFCLKYFETVDSLADAGAFGTDEDIMTVMREKLGIPRLFEKWTEFGEKNYMRFNNYTESNFRKFFWHVAMLGHWRDVVLQQIHFLQKVGFTGDLTVGVAGDSGKDLQDIITILKGSKIPCRIVYHGSITEGWEFPTIALLNDACQLSETKEVVYMHAKGVSKPSCGIRTAWRAAHMFELLRHHSTSNLLAGYDTAMAFPSASGKWLPPNYINAWCGEGNFWAATSEHIKSLPPLRETFMACGKHPEFSHQWIGMNSFFRVRVLNSYHKLFSHAHTDIVTFLSEHPEVADFYLEKAAEPVLEAPEEFAPADFTITECLSMFNCRNCDLGTDKMAAHSYHIAYEELLGKYKNSKSSLLEIGVNSGYSLFAWALFFGDESDIVGVDIVSKSLKVPGARVIQADATTKEFADTLEDLSFDVIIDDGSHNPTDIRKSFELLFQKVKPGGVYIVEDIADMTWLPEFFGTYQHKVFDLRKESGVGDSVLVAVTKPDK